MNPAARIKLKPDAVDAIPKAPANSNDAKASAKGRPTPSHVLAMRRDDREFLPAALEIIEQPPSPIRLTLIWFFVLATFGALLWGWFGKIDIYAVAPGRIQPAGRSKVVQPLEPGKVATILVANGTRVRSGEPLIELDATETGVDLDLVTAELDGARAETVRRTVALDVVQSGQSSSPPIPFADGLPQAVRYREKAMLDADLVLLTAQRASLEGQIAERASQKARFQASVAERDKLVALLSERVTMRQTLVDRNSGSRALVIEAMTEMQREAATRAAESGQIEELDRSIASLKRRIEEGQAQFVMDQTAKRAEAERRAEKASQDLVKAHSRKNRTRLLAPIDGTVQQLAVTTTGQVVAAAQPILLIVPADEQLEIEALVANKDIGFVRPGQEVTIKVESFPFTRFGTLNGQVRTVSTEAMDEREAGTLANAAAAAKSGNISALSAAPSLQNLVFLTTVSLDQSVVQAGDKEIRLSPGMAVTVEIRTGERRVLDYIFSPLREVRSEAIRER